MIFTCAKHWTAVNLSLNQISVPCWQLVLECVPRSPSIALLAAVESFFRELDSAYSGGILGPCPEIIKSI